MGAALFATALVTQSLTARVRRNEALIQQQRLDVANLAALNSQILQTMQSGVIALDSNDEVRHFNDQAQYLLQEATTSTLNSEDLPFPLSRQIPVLYEGLKNWRLSPQQNAYFNIPHSESSDIQISFHQLLSDSHQGTLIFLDDLSRLKQQMQQSKLASLGS